ncbi:MAG: hypothetical protein H6724_11410 [Sandaracinus sp.]|nr:hypothetical protein [Sandaracinus sp.]
MPELGGPGSRQRPRAYRHGGDWLLVMVIHHAPGDDVGADGACCAWPAELEAPPVP